MSWLITIPDSWQNTINYPKKSSMISYLAWNWFIIKCTWLLMSMKIHFLMDLLVFGVYWHQKGHIDLYLDQNWYAIKPTQDLTPMDKHSKMNSNTWLILDFLRNMVSQNGICLVSLLQKRWSCSLLSQKTCQAQKIFAVYYIWYYATNLRYKYFTKIDILMQYHTFE